MNFCSKETYDIERKPAIVVRKNSLILLKFKQEIKRSQLLVKLPDVSMESDV